VVIFNMHCSGADQERDIVPGRVAEPTDAEPLQRLAAQGEMQLKDGTCEKKENC
jgi:hypothetical protein